MVVFFSLLLFIIPIACSDAGGSGIQRLQEALNSKEKTSVPLPDSFKLSPELLNGLTLDGAKTLFEILLNVTDYDEYKNTTSILEGGMKRIETGPLTEELVSAMGPDVCALFAGHYASSKRPEVTIKECISIFIKNMANPEYSQAIFKKLPMDWFAQHPVKLLNALTAEQLNHLSPSIHPMDLNNPNNCQGLTVAMALKLLRLDVIPSNKCISKIADLDTLEFYSSQRLTSSPEAFCYYNGPLSKSVTIGLSENHLQNYASRVEGDIICQNLCLELAKRGIRKVTARCLHGYFHTGLKNLDIGKVPPKTIKQWISEYPADVQKLDPVYLRLLHHSCWQHILRCRDNLNQEFLETITPNTIQTPIVILDLSPEYQELIRKYAPSDFLESVKIQFSTKSLLASLNSGCRKTANQIMGRQGEYPNEFFSELTVTGAKTLLCSSCGVKDYDSLVQLDFYLEKAISLGFTDWIKPEQVPDNPKVCAVFLHAVRNFKGGDRIPTECWELHLDELIKFGILNVFNFFYFPTNVLKSRATDLFIILSSNNLAMPHFSDDLVQIAIKDPEACSRMKLDYFSLYPHVVIHPECVARLSDLGITGDAEFKGLGPDAFSYYDGPLSDALLKRITIEQIASFGERLNRPLICRQLNLRQISSFALKGVTLACIRGYFSKPAKETGSSFQSIPDSVLVQWTRLDPQNFQNLALSDRTRIPQSVWADVLQYHPKLNLALAKELFNHQDDIGILDLPSYNLDEMCLRALLDAVPLLGHALMVRAKTLPVNLYDILGPQLIAKGITVCHQKRAGIHLFATLENVENVTDIISNIPHKFCAGLSKGEYLRYTWLRANFSEECRKHFQFPSDHLTPELSFDPHERSNGLDALKMGHAPRPSPLDLEEMLTDIIWSHCDQKHCSKGRICARGQLHVPSNYLDPTGGLFTLTIYRYTQHDQTPRAHLIFLPGGPGGPGLDFRNDATMISELTKGDVATYLVDHRGLGESGQFTEMHDSWEAETSDLKSTFANKKFDEKDLRLESAALDVVMVGLAILHTHPADRLSIYGFSFGALWAHEVVRFAPDLVDSVVLGGMPPLKGILTDHNLQDVLELCRLDPFCRSKMGSDVLDSFPKIVKQLGDPATNECVKVMHSKFGVFENTVEGRIKQITNRLAKFCLDPPLIMDSYANIQILLPFVKATIDCIDASIYSLHVLDPLYDILPPVAVMDGENSLFVQTVVNADYYVPSTVSFNLYPPNPPDLHPYHYYASDIHQLPFCKHCLVGRNRNSPEPLTTNKTAFYFLQGLFDPQTPFNLAKQVFDSVKAPLKVFQPVNNRGHGGFGLGEIEYIIAAVYGQSVSMAQQLIEKSAESQPMKWEFAGPDDPFSRLWSCVNDAP
ncbi:Proteinase (Secreted protein), partial [Paramicrosporidium saccamoebae]